MMGYSFGANFAAILHEYESGAGGALVTRAYRDPKGKWTGPAGMTFHQDGRAVAEGDTWTEAQALALIAWGKQHFADEVARALPPGLVLTQNQFDALGLLAWNAGPDVLRQGGVAEALSAVPPRFEEAAARMTLYRRMTLWGGTAGPDGSLARGPDGKVMEKGQSWFKAMRGIYRRSCASACLMLSLDWREATAPDRIHMAKRPDWVPAENRWVDTVVDQTAWKDIHDVARRSPIPDRPALIEVAAKVQPAPVTGRITAEDLPADWNTLTAEEKTDWLNGESKRRITPAETAPAKLPPAVPAKPKTATATKATPVKVDQVPYLDEAAKAEVKVKNIQDSQRGTGFARQKQAEALGTAAVGGWMADQMGLVKPILEFTGKYTPSQIASGALILGVPVIGLWYYGKWRRRKGEADADTLLK